MQVGAGTDSAEMLRRLGREVLITHGTEMHDDNVYYSLAVNAWLRGC